MDGLVGSRVPGHGSESDPAEPGEPGQCSPRVFRLESKPGHERIAAIGNYDRAVLVFGPNASAAEVTAWLDALAQQAPNTACTNIVLAPKERIAEFQELIDADRLFYLSRGVLRERDLDALIESALSSQRSDVSLDRHPSANDLRRMALAQSVSELADALRSAAGNAVRAERTRCVLFDRQRQVLWTPNEPGQGESPAVGLVSFIQRTGMTVCLPRLGDDPRFDLDLDNPYGASSDRFLGVPIRAGRGATMAVLVVVRPAQEPPFEPLDIAEMEAIAAHAGPYVTSWLVGSEEADGPFRSSALRALDQPLTAGPEPLRLEAKWMRRTPWLAIAAFAAFVLALAFVRVPEYATGSAIVRDDGAVVATFLDASTAQIRPGMVLRFDRQSLPIESVQQRGAKTIVITTRLPRNHAGARGKAEVRVRASRLLFSLAPALKGWPHG